MAEDDLPVFVMTEDIPTCPDCGARTNWDDLPNGRQHHKCQRCGKEFLMAPAEEDEPDEVTIKVTYYSMLITPESIVEGLLEWEGVKAVVTEKEDSTRERVVALVADLADTLSDPTQAWDIGGGLQLQPESPGQSGRR